MQENQNEEENVKRGYIFKTILIAASLMLLVVGISSIIKEYVKENQTQQSIFSTSRQATNDDILFEEDILNSIINFNNTYTIITLENIYDFSITFKFFDGNIKMIKIDTKYFGNVAKGSKINITFDLSKDDWKKVQSYTYETSGKIYN